MKNEIICADGYTITQNEKFPRIVRYRFGKANDVNVLNLKPVELHSSAGKHISSNGKNLSDYLTDGTVIIRYNTETRAWMDAIIAEQRAIEDKKDTARADEQAARDAEAAEMPNFLAVKFIFHGNELLCARHLTEREKFGLSDYAANGLFIRVGDAVKLPYNTQTVRDIKARGADGLFSGCDNIAVKITQDEWDKVVAEQAAEEQEINARKQVAESEKQSRQSAQLEEAKITGKPVVIGKWVTDRCMNHHEGECSFDAATRWMNPDGSTEVTYTCCY